MGIKQYKENEALKGYAEGRLSLGKAAEHAGISLWRFLELLKDKSIALKYDVDGLRKELTS